jgi:hypothetical protein
MSLVVKIPDQEIVATVTTDWRWFESFVKAGGPVAEARLQKWNAKRSGPIYRPVKEFLSSFRHDTLYKLDLFDIETVAGVIGGKPRHALEGLVSADSKYDGVHNFSPPFAIEYLLHDCLERLGRMPRWADVVQYIFLDRRERYIEPFLSAFNLHGSPKASAGSPHMKALQWRVGTAFYSFMREVHLLTALRQRHGLDVRYHVLADVEFKADLVAGETLLAVYVPNEDYRDGGRGRKLSIADANPGRSTLEMRIEVRDKYGYPWIALPESVSKIAEKLKAAGCPVLANETSEAA